MRLTIIQPCLGRRKGRPYIRTWQMEPLAPAVLAALTPRNIEVRFYDDRMEPVPYEEPTDLAALTVETFTAKRACQIASRYRAKGVPVVMGGFHPTLVPEEAARYAESVVIGEAEGVWPRLLADFRAGSLRRLYRGPQGPPLSKTPDRSIFAGKQYLPIRLVEWGRGCRFACEFCSIQACYGRTYRRRPIADVVEEVRGLRGALVFFVDDNLVCDPAAAKELLRALAPLRIQWVGQASLHAAQDEELLRLLRGSGCQGLLIGLETLDSAALDLMGKPFNKLAGGYDEALDRLRRHGIRLYGTFMLGYGRESPGSFQQVLDFALSRRFYLAAFNHLVPFPGTPLYRRLKEEKRLLYESWWLDPAYRYGMLPFSPEGLGPEEVAQGCLQARRSFFTIPSILRRAMDPEANLSGLRMGFSYFLINWMMRREVGERAGLPLGDEDFEGPILQAQEAEVLDGVH